MRNQAWKVTVQWPGWIALLYSCLMDNVQLISPSSSGLGLD